MKQIKLGHKMSEHDMEYRVKQVKKWLDKGEQVKVRLWIYGRSRYLSDINHKETIEIFLQKCSDFSTHTPIKEEKKWTFTSIIQKKKK